MIVAAAGVVSIVEEGSRVQALKVIARRMSWGPRRRCCGSDSSEEIEAAIWAKDHKLGLCVGLS